MTAQDLDALLTRVSMADRKAFAALYSATSAKLFGICLRILKDRAMAEDALQDIYVKIWKRADAYQPGRVQPMTWLITVARNHAIDLLRKRRTAATDNAEGDETRIDRLETHEPGPAEQLLQKDTRAQISACLDELADEKAEAVRQAYLYGATYAELAAHFAVPLNTMRTWLRRSLQALRTCLSR
ncbi:MULTISPECIES: sigma-70 family RNA polymerase sigma factor [Marinovum]|uniref:sigma-70 family RNA polymerase sigma factor n=1 Tax=Marinovum TaxID=367771 RepID=UPI00065B1273|nr:MULTISPECIES: sigma-70 family RNA polymerase sigma factor [Marinovum]AKO96278.1 RNA polymerase sigma factor, sigma-70 family [Marinovum algicola DG 898]MDD9738759.1 sigma-70 family RNA polymerase sigma factor [Marinovum sp. SP66]MDD9743396.1 sigma-70 family RNA polymerase sigma factor [Marinovum sp. PR37]